MNISELISNPKKLEKVFLRVLKRKDEKMARVLVEYINNPTLVYLYAKDIVGGKVSDKLEEVIVKNPTYSYYYAKYVLKGPFPKGEDSIATVPFTSYYYAKYVLRQPFPKGEEVIINGGFLSNYIEFLESIGELDEFYKRHPELKPKNKEV